MGPEVTAELLPQKTVEAMRDRVPLTVDREAQELLVLAARPCLLCSAALRLAEIVDNPNLRAAAAAPPAGA